MAIHDESVLTEDLLPDPDVTSLDRKAQPLFVVPHQLLHPPMLGDVMSHDREPGGFTELVVDGAVRRAHEKLRAVFSDPPAFHRDTAALHGRFDRVSVHATLHIFRRKEDGDVLPENLVGCVAIESLSSDVPTRYPSFGIEPEDGVVADPVDQESELFFAVTPRCFRLQALGDVAKVKQEVLVVFP